MTIRFEYDARGRRVASMDAAGNRTQWEYDDAGDVMSVTRPDGSKSIQTYDARGNPASQTDGGLTRRTEFDSAGRLVRLVNENDAETRFGYDVMDRLTQEVGFDGRTQAYQYNAAGQLVQSDDAGLTTLWHYDDEGQLIRQQRPGLSDGPDDVLWRYDASGRVLETGHRSETHLVSVRFQYDANDNLTGERQIIHNASGDLLWQHTVRRQFDPRGVESSLTCDGLPDIRWQTYGPGDLLGVRLGDDVLLELTRDKLHREITRQFGQDWQSASTYARTGQLAGQHALSGGHLTRNYHYNAAGQMTQMSTGGGGRADHPDRPGGQPHAHAS
jgi:YD repeat-containing protein